MMRKLALAVMPVIASLVLATPAFAGPIVDPNTLQPVPPNATCRDNGQQIICDTFLEESGVKRADRGFRPAVRNDLRDSYYRGDGTRWYVDRLAVKRHVGRAWTAPGASRRPAPDRRSRSADTGA